jgi:cytochrome c oxidase subunit IV
MTEPVAVAAAADAHAGGHHVNYMAKFWWLVGLTIAEVLVAVLLSGGVKLPLLGFLAFWKAGIVLNHFMHLKTEGLALKLTLAFPFALIVILVMLFLADGYFLGYAAA